MGGKIDARVAYLPPGPRPEDYPKIEEFFGRIFTRFEAIGREELEERCFGADPCDLLLVDCRLGETEECLALVREIKRRDTAPPLLTLYDVESLERLPRLVEEGVRYFFPVPWTGEAIRHVLRPLIELLTLPRRLRTCRRMLEECRRERGARLNSEECRDLRNRVEAVESFFRLKAREMETHIHEAKNMTALMTQTDLDEKQREYLSRMDHAVSGLGSLIREVREYYDPARNAGGIVETFNLNSVLESSSEARDRDFEAADIDLIFEMDRSVPSRIRGNPVLLGQTLINLFDSLIELDGGGEVLLRLSMEEPEGESEEETLHFELRHTGEIHEALGDPVEFLKGHAGVGEAARWIREMGGALQFGRGGDEPLISFSLPTRRQDRRSYRLPSRAWMEKSMLIIDGNEHSAEALEMMLRYFHFHVERAGSVREALQQLYNRSFDLIFVKEDLFDEFVREGISLRRGAALVMVTRDEELRKRNAEYVERVDAFLSLPFTQQKIFDLLLKVYAEEKLEGVREALEILKENLIFLLGGKTALYIGRSGSDLQTVQGLLESIHIVVLKSEGPQRAAELMHGADLIFIDDHLSAREWEELLLFCRSHCGKRPVFALLHERTPEKEKALKMAGVGNLIDTPLDSEEFYRLLLDEMLERGTL